MEVLKKSPFFPSFLLFSFFFFSFLSFFCCPFFIPFLKPGRGHLPLEIWAPMAYTPPPAPEYAPANVRFQCF